MKVLVVVMVFIVAKTGEYFNGRGGGRSDNNGYKRLSEGTLQIFDEFWEITIHASARCSPTNAATFRSDPVAIWDSTNALSISRLDRAASIRS